jgi:hypothetical protein
LSVLSALAAVKVFETGRRTEGETMLAYRLIDVIIYSVELIGLSRSLKPGGLLQPSSVVIHRYPPNPKLTLTGDPKHSKSTFGE